VGILTVCALRCVEQTWFCLFTDFGGFIGYTVGWTRTVISGVPRNHVYLFVPCLTALSVVCVFWRLVTGLMLNGESERMWKEAVVA